LRLVRSVSHELRNMLNSVGLASGLLDAANHESVEFMRRNLSLNTAHMRSVLDDLLNLSNLLSKGTPVKPSVFAPARLLELLQVSFTRMAEEKELEFSCEVEPSLGPLHRRVESPPDH
jgi:signal transduction histidine kinase